MGGRGAGGARAGGPGWSGCRPAGEVRGEGGKWGGGRGWAKAAIDECVHGAWALLDVRLEHFEHALTLT
jgi:hypothetical protein